MKAVFLLGSKLLTSIIPIVVEVGLEVVRKRIEREQWKVAADRPILGPTVPTSPDSQRDHIG